MCQMSVLLEMGNDPEIVMENVSQLEVTDEGIKVSTLFEEPKIIADVKVTRIDFMNGKVFLGASG